MKTLYIGIVMMSTTALLSSCAVETVNYNSPGYDEVVYTNANFGRYPSYYWGYQNYYTPVYYSGGYYSRWGNYRSGWSGWGARGGWGGGFHGRH